MFYVLYQALKSVSQQQPLSIRLGFGDQWQQDIPQIRGDLARTQNAECFSQIQHLGNRRRLLQTVSTQGTPETCDLGADLRVTFRCPQL